MFCSNLTAKALASGVSENPLDFLAPFIALDFAMASLIILSILTALAPSNILLIFPLIFYLRKKSSGFLV